MKAILTAFFAALLFASPAHAVSIQVLQSNSDFMEFNQGGTVFRIFLSDLRQGSIALKSADLLSRLVELTQVRDLRSSFPLDEPTRMVDPGLTFGEQFFWCDANGIPTPDDTVATTHVCAQDNIITEVLFDDASGSFSLSIRVSQNCASNPAFISCAP